MDCGLLGQSKVFAFCRLLLNCVEREGSSDDAGELLLPAPPALERLLIADLCVSGRPSSSTQFSSRRGARRS